MTRVQPIRDEDLAEVCAFLGRTLSPKLAGRHCVNAFLHPWAAEKPNNGFMLVSEDQVVGVLGAIYSDQMIRGNLEPFCNLTSWSVLKEFRSESMTLMGKVLSQPGYHFTSFTPNPALVALYRSLKFVPLEHHQWIVPCVPWPSWGTGSILTDPAEVERTLTPAAAKIFRDHRELDWIRAVALGRGDSYGLVLYRRRQRKRHVSAEILHVSDGELFIGGHRRLAGHLFRKERALSFTVDARFLPRRPVPSIGIAGSQIRLFLTKSLRASDFALIYSEVVALDV